jgi:hypothetical protein
MKPPPKLANYALHSEADGCHVLFIYQFNRKYSVEQQTARNQRILASPLNLLSQGEEKSVTHWFERPSSHVPDLIRDIEKGAGGTRSIPPRWIGNISARLKCNPKSRASLAAGPGLRVVGFHRVIASGSRVDQASRRILLPSYLLTSLIA